MKIKSKFYAKRNQKLLCRIFSGNEKGQLAYQKPNHQLQRDGNSSKYWYGPIFWLIGLHI